MLLGKSCHKKDHILQRRTLKLGTLSEYRETEIEQIADNHEGTLTFNINFIGAVDIERKWFNTIFARAIGFKGGSNEPIERLPGRTLIHVNRIICDNTSTDPVTLRDSSATIKREAIDSFIFCMSGIRKTHECIGMFPDYDAYWYVKSMHAESFGLTIGRILLTTIKERHKAGEYIISKDTCMETLEIYLELEDVIYSGRNIEISNNSIIPLDDYMRRMHSMAFIKPPQFQHEKEVRFMYTIVSNGKIVPPIVKSVILDAESLLPLIL